MQQLVEQKNGPVGAKARLLRPLRWAALTLTGIVLIAIAGNVRLHSVLHSQGVLPPRAGLQDHTRRLGIHGRNHCSHELRRHHAERLVGASPSNAETRTGSSVATNREARSMTSVVTSAFAKKTAAL